MRDADLFSTEQIAELDEAIAEADRDEGIPWETVRAELFSDHRSLTAPATRYAHRMAVVDKLLEQALQLPETERGALASRLLRSLESDDDEELAPDEWEAAWSEEIDRRMREIRDGKVQLVDGDAVFRAAAERIASRRP